MERTVKLAKQVALTDYTILINGESGTGKELFAQGGADVFLNSLGNQSKRSACTPQGSNTLTIS